MEYIQFSQTVVDFPHVVKTCCKKSLYKLICFMGLVLRVVILNVMSAVIMFIAFLLCYVGKYYSGITQGYEVTKL